MPLRFRILPAWPSGHAARVAAVISAGLAEGPLAERIFDVDSALEEVRIGRLRGVEVELPFASVSARHARLLRGETSTDWRLEDLGSMNGTWLDGQRLSPLQPVALRPGQRLRVAAVDILFEGWSSSPLAIEGTATMARRLISDLFGAVGGEVPTLTVELAGTTSGNNLRMTEHDRPYLVGRDPSCDLVLASDHVSREHASFRRQVDGVLLRDLGSKNGLEVNGNLIAGEHRLTDGDRIVVGIATLRFTDPEDRYLRRLESLAGPSSEEEASGGDRQTSDASVASVPPSGRLVTPTLVPAIDGALGPPKDEAPAREPSTAAPFRSSFRWVGTALIVAVVLAATAGLVILWFATH